MEIKVDSRVLWARNSEGDRRKKLEAARISLKKSRSLIFVRNCVFCNTVGTIPDWRPAVRWVE
jgi:hypothetical protein